MTPFKPSKKSLEINSAFMLRIPTRLVFGLGKAEEVGNETAQLGQRALVVSMPQMEQLGHLERVLHFLNRSNVRTTSWTKVRENPSARDVDEAFRLVKANGCDCIVALGGGSVIDTAKAISVIAATDPPSWDYVYSVAKKKVTRTLPIIALPTTSGTGSHMTGYAVISNDELGVKSTIVSHRICPVTSIVDPQFTIGLEPGLTACTGFDSFSHSFESYVNRNASVATDMMAEAALPLIVKNLPVAVREPGNVESRIALAWADTLAGILIFNSGTTLPHAMGQAISGKFQGVRHGQSLAAIYLAFMKFSFPGQPGKFARLGEWLDDQSGGLPTMEAAEKSVSAVSGFMDRIRLNIRVGDLGLRRSDLTVLTEIASESPDVRTNPVMASREDIAALFEQSY